jgi:hypothetical protein
MNEIINLINIFAKSAILSFLTSIFVTLRFSCVSYNFTKIFHLSNGYFQKYPTIISSRQYFKKNYNIYYLNSEKIEWKIHRSRMFLIKQNVVTLSKKINERSEWHGTHGFSSHFPTLFLHSMESQWPNAWKYGTMSCVCQYVIHKLWVREYIGEEKSVVVFNWIHKWMMKTSCISVWYNGIEWGGISKARASRWTV